VQEECHVALKILDDRLLDLIDPDYRVERISSGHVFTEGPVWHAREQHLTFSDVRRQVIHRWTESGGESVFRAPSNNANGNTYDHYGRLVTCAGRTVTRTNHAADVEVIADRFGDARLNKPNDVICAPNGDIIFTDPTFGLRDENGVALEREYPFSGVFRLSALDGSLTPLIDSIAWPNGLAMTGDGGTLYVNDSLERVVYAFDIKEDGSAGESRRFASLASGSGAGRVLPDGMKLDSLGNLYVAANSPDGVWVFAPDGALLGLIGLPEEQSAHGSGPGGASNLAWGDADWRTMFVTAGPSLYRCRLKVSGQAVRID
jgi:gluconolactonase